MVLWFTGLSGAGKSSIARALAEALRRRGKRVHILDGDEVRTTHHRHIGFTEPDIKENNRLIAGLAANYQTQYDVVLVPIISPFRESRAQAREHIGTGFKEVYVESSDSTRFARDPKGLYQKVRSGELHNMIGHGGVPYEPPEHPDIQINTDTETLEHSVALVLSQLL